MIRLILKVAFCLLLGVVLFIFYTSIFNVTYERSGSLDIISGAILEFFGFTVLLDLFHGRQQKVYKRELAKHLEEIEKLLREKRETE